MPDYSPPLQVHIVFAKDFDQGPNWSERLQHWLGGNEKMYSVPEPNIPVLVWNDKSGTLPPSIEWNQAQRSALLLLVDDSMLAVPEWRDWIEQQWQSMRDVDLFLPITVTPNFSRAGAALQRTNAIRLDGVKPYQSEDLLLFTTHALARWIARGYKNQKKVGLFISHAKAKSGKISGRDLAVELKKFIQSHPAGTVFFDEVEIGGGEDFAETLGEALDESVVIVLLTDVYSSRFWCGWEVLTSKQKHRPLIVVNALEQGEVTSLAYVGKTPTIRWNADAPNEISNPLMHRRIVACALAEQLRLYHDALQLEAIRGLVLAGDPSVRIAERPPELAILPSRAKNGDEITLLHVDPPLPRYELELMRTHRPDVKLASAAQALAGCVAGSRPLAGYRIAISISNGPDREQLGFTANAQERLWTRVATHLLAAGAEIAYGGDMRVGGYTEQLVDLAQSTADAGQALPAGIIHWYSGWPISAKLSVQEKAKIPAAFRLHLGEVPPPISKTASADWPPGDQVPEHHYAWTLGMSAMRQSMAADCHARILVGGQYLGVSPWPGLFEEFESFISKPIFLVGAFGGVTRLLIDLLQGRDSKVFSNEFQDAGGKRTPVREYYEGLAGRIDWKARTDRIRALGIAGLDNGLTPEENKRLFTTCNLTEIIALILRGLLVKTQKP